LYPKNPFKNEKCIDCLDGAIATGSSKTLVYNKKKKEKPQQVGELFGEGSSGHLPGMV
jgi:hypothetical protein